MTFPLTVAWILRDDFTFFPIKEDWEELEEFLDTYTFPDETIQSYKKAKKLSGFMDRTGVIFSIFAIFTFSAILIIPIFSLVAKYILVVFDPPSILQGYLSDTPRFQTSTIIVLLVLLAISITVTTISFKLSSKFSAYGDEIGLNENAVELRHIADCYRNYEAGNYELVIKSLKKYGGPLDFYTNRYAEAATPDGNVDNDYLEGTFEDFLELFIERLPVKSRASKPDLMNLIIERFDSEYYTEEVGGAANVQKMENSYLQILIKVASDLISGVTGKIIDFGLDSPLIFYLGLLVLGVGLIEINATLAVIVATILGGGFESWRRIRLKTEGDPKPTEQ